MTQKSIDDLQKLQISQTLADNYIERIEEDPNISYETVQKTKEIEEKYRNLFSKEPIIEICQVCRTEFITTKHDIKQELKRTGNICCSRVCGINAYYATNPDLSERGRKISAAKTGKKRSPESIEKFKKSLKRFYNSEEGQIARKDASVRSANNKNAKKNKLNGYHTSPKSTEPQLFCSSYELAAMIVLDQHPDVLFYVSQIPFITSNGRGRRADLLVEFADGTKKLIEIKPSSRVGEYLDQIKDNEEFAKKQGFVFEIWTEDEIGFGSEKKLIMWAKEYIKEHHQALYELWSKQKKTNTQKKSRKYNKKCKEDLITFFCEYCKKEHTVRRDVHRRNKKDHGGRYVCHQESAETMTPAKLAAIENLKKENPYAVNGKKECTKCKQIKLFSEFGTDKSRRDGYSNKCKECRASASLQSYYDKKN